MNFLCNKCYNTLKNPVECNNCHNNFCEEHINTFYNCPSCHAPFSGIINHGLKKLLDKYENERMNELIKNNEELIECSICPFKSKPGYFCFHLAEDHKKELIEKFGRKKIDKIDNEESQLIPKEIKNEKLKNDNNINSYNLNNQFENNKKKNYSINSGESNYNKNINKEIKVQNPLSRSEKLFYCNKMNESINCDCCPDHICCEGNCFCVKCMNYNCKRYHLKEGELYNKAGRIAKLECGEYHCGKNYNLSIKNSVGIKFHSHKKCSYYSKYFCPECEILNKYKDIYLDYISKNK